MNQLKSVRNAPLFWEAVSEGRWGKYISSIEADMIQFAHKELGQPTTALEIGAEGGRWAKMLANLGWQMTCTEIDPVAVEICQQRLPESHCILVDESSQEFPCDSDSKKLILAIEVHELVEQDWFMSEVDRVLQNGGVFVGVFQNKHSWRALLNLKSRLNGTMRHYTAAFWPWKRKMKAMGFEILREEGICWMPFGRLSNSRLVPAAAFLEKALCLRRLTALSPWIVFAVRKGQPETERLGGSNERTV
jgi:SAM-dependent methyltransferase